MAGTALGVAGTVLGVAGTALGVAGSVLGVARSAPGVAGSVLGVAGAVLGAAGNVLGIAGTVLGIAKPRWRVSAIKLFPSNLVFIGNNLRTPPRSRPNQHQRGMGTEILKRKNSASPRTVFEKW